jgi:2-polyprenyl-6-methoxyphenol hydroxylase-like FAD-dependent oxidoreductase
MEATMENVLIVGAGPTGLALALWLTRQGIAVRIIDKSAGPGEASRALAVQARTLELYQQLGLADAVVAAGHEVPAINLWAQGRHRARLSFGDAGAGVTAYPYLLIYPQDQHERLLVDRLRALGVDVERKTELIGFEDQGDHVRARLRLPDGSEQACDARYLAGCDGARSTVRHQLGTGFEGGTYRHVFYVADAEVSGPQPPGEAHIALDRGDFVAVLPYSDSGRVRLIGTVRDERADRADTLAFDDVSHDAMQSLGVTVHKLNWFSTYHVHHRIASSFRDRRVFLLGDAAHVHSPAGGQGMNTGILDANNLAWKLAAVLNGNAPDSLLDTYGLERQAFARKLVDTTDRVFSFVTRQGDLAEFVRLHIAPAVMGVAYKLDSVREFMFRMISQTTLNYHESPLSQGKAGEVQGGDRLPWVRPADTDNYAPLAVIGWQVHVYGEAGSGLRSWCERHRVALHEFAWTPVHQHYGLARNAAYLLRPDTYVALADEAASPEALREYFGRLGVSPGATA